MTLAGFARLVSGLVRTALLLLGLAVAATSAPAAAAPGVDEAVRLPVCVAAQRPGDTAASVLAQPARFECRAAEWQRGSGDFWVWLRLPPAVGADPPQRELTFVPQWQQAMTVHVRDAAGNLTTDRYPDSNLTGDIRIGATFRVNLPGGERSARDVLLRIDGALNASGLIGDPHITPHEGADGEELIATAIFAAFAGLGVGLFCYNIVLWLTIRERFQLTYCLSLLAMLAYAWSSSGAMAEQFPALPNTVRLGTSYVMLAFVAALALQFITDFIEQDKMPVWLRASARQLGAINVIAALMVVFAPEDWRHLADRAYVYSFIPLPLMVLVMTLVAWRCGSRSVRVLAIAWALPTAMAVVRIAHALHLIHYGVLVQYALVAAMSVEALLSSLAMSFRIKLITDERDRALIDERAARHLASVDSLTGLLNRRALLEQVIAWASPEPLRLLIVDIDRFKLINDRHGHLVGDEVLREVAEVLAIRSDLRGSVARLGGEEFALIGTAAELHEGIALGILADIRARAMAGDVQVTVSIGMAEGMVRCEDEWRELYRRADAALYRAKDEGRNRAVHDEPAAASAKPGTGRRAIA